MSTQEEKYDISCSIRAQDVLSELYSLLCELEAPDGYLDDLDRISDWLSQ